jgi:hypothetical protein
VVVPYHRSPGERWTELFSECRLDEEPFVDLELVTLTYSQQ